MYTDSKENEDVKVPSAVPRPTLRIPMIESRSHVYIHVDGAGLPPVETSFCGEVQHFDLTFKGPHLTVRATKNNSTYNVFTLSIAGHGGYCPQAWSEAHQ